MRSRDRMTASSANTGPPRPPRPFYIPPRSARAYGPISPPRPAAYAAAPWRKGPPCRRGPRRGAAPPWEQGPRRSGRWPSGTPRRGCRLDFSEAALPQRPYAPPRPAPGQPHRRSRAQMRQNAPLRFRRQEAVRSKGQSLRIAALAAKHEMGADPSDSSRRTPPAANPSAELRDTFSGQLYDQRGACSHGGLRAHVLWKHGRLATLKRSRRSWRIRRRPDSAPPPPR
jgi:hypothetical protein